VCVRFAGSDLHDWLAAVVVVLVVVSPDGAGDGGGSYS
jgi:hypothetical protein